jgi:hypothetical protein
LLFNRIFLDFFLVKLEREMPNQRNWPVQSWGLLADRSPTMEEVMFVFQLVLIYTKAIDNQLD